MPPRGKSSGKLSKVALSSPPSIHLLIVCSRGSGEALFEAFTLSAGHTKGYDVLATVTRHQKQHKHPHLDIEVSVTIEQLGLDKVKLPGCYIR